VLCEIFCVACGLFSFIKGERERERERIIIISFCLGLSFLRRQKPKKRRKMDGQPSPLLHRALSHPHHRLQYYLSISISRAQTRPRVPRVPLGIARRAHCVRGISTFLFGWTSSRQHSSQSLFLSFRAVFRDRKMAFQSKAL